jgi:hypothetical protein
VLTSAIAVLAGLALLVPGFIVAELATTGRARTRGSDFELALRALAYALIVHLALLWWTVDLVDSIGPVEDWANHASELGAYAAVVLVAIPVVAGTLLNLFLRSSERTSRPLPLWAALLGGRDARDAFDYAVSGLEYGGWIIVELRARAADGGPRFVAGTFGTRSHAGLSPHAHNLYLQQEWEVAPRPSGVPPRFVRPRRPTRGVVISADEIAVIHVVRGPRPQ